MRCSSLPPSLLVLLALLSPVASGCGTLNLRSVDFLGLVPSSDEQTPEGEVGPTSVVVEIHPEGKQSQRMTTPFQQGMVVQDVLEKSGVTRRFRKMQITLKRKTANRFERVPMEVKYDRSRRQAEAASNYAVYPGDVLVIVEDRSTVVDDLLSSAFGPLNAGGKRR